LKILRFFLSHLPSFHHPQRIPIYSGVPLDFWNIKKFSNSRLLNLFFSRYRGRMFLIWNNSYCLDIFLPVCVKKKSIIINNCNNLPKVNDEEMATFGTFISFFYFFFTYFVPVLVALTHLK
jgi:hypothetical protein